MPPRTRAGAAGGGDGDDEPTLLSIVELNKLFKDVVIFTPQSGVHDANKALFRAWTRSIMLHAPVLEIVGRHAKADFGDIYDGEWAKIDHKPNAMGSDKGPWPHRAEEPWRSMNKVKDVEGYDGFFAAGEASEAPLKLDADTLSGDLAPLKYKKYDLLIVGAGLSGAVLAERCSQELGMTSLIIDVRDHIGGNCYDYLDESGIRCS
ncbi:hypothetical protein AURANDRAFT_69147, partial [Aureococcus anophagefferens]